MNIYVSHSSGFNFKDKLYNHIKSHFLDSEHTFVLPHEKSEDLFNSRDFLKNKADLVIAEVSYPSLGVGIELGWANFCNVPIICIHKKNSKISNSIKAISNNIIEYFNSEDLILKLKEFLKKFNNSTS